MGTPRDQKATKATVPVHHKLLLTLDEASSYTGLGINRLREISHDPEFADQVIYFSGRRRLFKRTRLDEWFYLDAGRESIND